jgi:hypothetical protein
MTTHVVKPALGKNGGGPNGTRSNLQNSSTRFHCTLITGSLTSSRRLTGPAPVLGLDVVRGLELNQRPLGYGSVLVATRFPRVQRVTSPVPRLAIRLSADLSISDSGTGFQVTRMKREILAHLQLHPVDLRQKT